MKRVVVGIISRKNTEGVEQYLLVSSKKYFGIFTGYYYPPGGHLEEGEEEVACLKRELKEELGIEAKEWIDLGLVDALTTIIKSPQRLFVAKKLKFGKANQEDTESVKLVKIKLDQATQMVMNSKITHGPSCVLILKALQKVNK